MSIFCQWTVDEKSDTQIAYSHLYVEAGMAYSDTFRWVAEQNIARYRELVRFCTDEVEIRRLEHLLACEIEKLGASCSDESAADPGAKMRSNTPGQREDPPSNQNR